MLREYCSSAGGEPSPWLKEGKSNGAAMEPTDITTVQVPAKASLTQDAGTDWVFGREPGPLPLWERLLMNVRERIVHRDRLQEHHHRMPWKTTEEGIQQLRQVAVLEVLFGRDGQHGKDPEKVRCTGEILGSLAHLGPSQYSTFMATLNVEDTQETVGSTASKFRNFESTVQGPMQAHISSVVMSLKEKNTDQKKMHYCSRWSLFVSENSEQIEY